MKQKFHVRFCRRGVGGDSCIDSLTRFEDRQSFSIPISYWAIPKSWDTNSIQWQVFGPYFIPGSSHIEEFLKQNCRWILAFLSLCIMPADEARLYFQLSLSVFSRRSLESILSYREYKASLNIEEFLSTRPLLCSCFHFSEPLKVHNSDLASGDIDVKTTTTCKR